MSKYTAESFADMVNKNIAKKGYHLTHVYANESSFFNYSTGITRTYGLPEVFISSLPPGLSGDFVSSYISRFSKSGLSTNCLVPSDGIAPFDYYLIWVKEGKLDEYVLASIKFYDSAPFEYLQIVFPDTNMKFAHEEGYDYDQEMLGDYNTARMA